MTTKTDEQELLPCPFCGAGTTEVQENGRPWLGTKWGEPVSVSVRHWCDHIDGQPSRMIERVGRDRAAAIDAWNRRADLQSQKYTSAIGEAGQAYMDSFKYAHPLPVQFRWSELWEVMCVAANKGRTDATQSQDREDDPLQPAANWLIQAIESCTVADIQGRLSIGYNRAQRLFDHARRVEGEASATK